jgi:outer membrane protein OmpA-like peptidoglycan-associated protein
MVWLCRASGMIALAAVAGLLAGCADKAEPQPYILFDAFPPSPIFFGWGSVALTAQANNTLLQESQILKAHPRSLHVIGYTDRSGDEAINIALSKHRATVVAERLVELGVNKDDLTVCAYGSSRPLVETRPGVREPQNRRVELRDSGCPQ